MWPLQLLHIFYISLAPKFFYVHIIQAVQPEGPYDQGGYSLDGLIAYEVMRQ